jgi:hypothetical protein
MRQLIGALLVVFGVCFGLYIGIWWGFIGGIVAVAEALKATEVAPYDVAYGVARIFFCQFLGFAAYAIFYIPVYFIMRE